MTSSRPRPSAIIARRPHGSVRTEPGTGDLPVAHAGPTPTGRSVAGRRRRNRSPTPSAGLGGGRRGRGALGSGHERLSDDIKSHLPLTEQLAEVPAKAG